VETTLEILVSWGDATVQCSLEIQQRFTSLGHHLGELELKEYRQTAWAKRVDLLTEPKNP